MATGTPAEAAIRERIARDGRITFRQFMEMALYSAPGSYYGSASPKMGAEGDFFTSPEAHPSFGALVARQVEQVWIAMDRPARFDVVEMGPGTGALARDILSYAHRWSPRFHRALTYILVERSPALVQRQQRTLAELGPVAERVIWHPESALELGDTPDEGCFLSNELPDSFPVHRVALVNGELREIYVEVRDGELVETLHQLSDPRLATYFEGLGLLPPEGARVEVNLSALDWMAGVARALRRGVILTIDYGYPAEELYSPRHHDGTLLCFYRHTLGSDPYARIGRQDMTTHVDFTSLRRVGLEHGVQTLGLATQQSFLSALGMGGFLAALPGMGLRLRDYEANRMAMLELLKPDGLGRVRVLVQQKGLDGLEPAGLRPDGLLPDDLQRAFSHEPAPLLTRSHMRLTTPPQMDAPMDVEGMWRELLGDDDS